MCALVNAADCEARRRDGAGANLRRAQLFGAGAHGLRALDHHEEHLARLARRLAVGEVAHPKRSRGLDVVEVGLAEIEGRFLHPVRVASRCAGVHPTAARRARKHAVLRTRAERRGAKP